MSLRALHGLMLGLLLATVTSATPAKEAASPDPAELSRIQGRADALAQELAKLCPMTAPGDQVAFTSCRKALYGDSLLRRNLHPILLWGRARALPLNETPLTQFAPDVFTSLYAPLFMFAGTADVEYDAREKLYKATLPVRFRNRLPPGQFPYPFWHDKTKWACYQTATAMVLFMAPQDGAIRAAQYLSAEPGKELAAQAEAQAAAFDGQWLWTDAAGRTQPEVTLFDGLYRPENPFLPKIESSYKALALELRAGECDSCHSPGNPHYLPRLVLMQTPAHAAGEIKRILRAVRDGSMPHDEFGVEKALAEDVKARLLEKAETFDATLTAARAWESSQASTP